MAGQGYQVGKGFTVPTALVNPVTALQLTPSTTGGSLGGTYYIIYTFANANGETLGRAEQNVAVSGSTGQLSISLGAGYWVSGATAVNIYASTVSGQESYQGQILYANLAAGFTMTSLATGGRPVPQWNTTSFVDINPSALGLAAGSEFVIHNLYYNNPIAFGTWDGTTLVMFDGDTSNGAREDVSHHCNANQWIRAYNQNAYTQLAVSFDGMQTQ
jgi:hypothetical protein